MAYSSGLIDLSFVKAITEIPETTTLNKTVELNTTTQVIQNTTQAIETTTTILDSPMEMHYFPSLNITVFWKQNELTTQFEVKFDMPAKFVFGWVAIGINTKPEMVHFI